MPYSKVLDSLKSIISEREKEGITPRLSSLYCLVGSLYSAHEFNINYQRFLENKEESFRDNLFSDSILVGYLIAKALKNDDLPQRFKFILETLYEMTEPLQKKMVNLRECTTKLEEIKTPNDFIIKNLEDICEELSKLNFPITHKNKERGLLIEAWWKEKILRKM